MVVREGRRTEKPLQIDGIDLIHVTAHLAFSVLLKGWQAVRRHYEVSMAELFHFICHTDCPCSYVVIPGLTRNPATLEQRHWIPAFAGMTARCYFHDPELFV